MEKLVLHFCCGPCGAGVIEKLADRFSITGYFYNPNIWPPEEYEKRLKAAEKVAKIMKIEIIPGPYKNSIFEEKARHLVDEKEGGERCLICYRIRLQKTAVFAKEKGIGTFTTTLSISPHKDTGSINRIGLEIAKKYGINFYESDFKKDNGFGISVRLSKELGLYRQKYCGCRYSAIANNKSYQ